MNTREFVGARPDIIIIIVIIVYYAEATQYSEAIKQTKKTQYTNSVYRTEIFPLSHAASTKCSHIRDLIAYGQRFRDGMLYL